MKYNYIGSLIQSIICHLYLKIDFDGDIFTDSFARKVSLHENQLQWTSEVNEHVPFNTSPILGILTFRLKEKQK